MLYIPKMLTDFFNSYDKIYIFETSIKVNILFKYTFLCKNKQTNKLKFILEFWKIQNYINIKNLS